MTKKIRSYFSHESNISKVVFSLVIVAVFGLVFGQSAFAQFVRLTDGTTGGAPGWGYGYGYGYGYGAGSDGGANSYRVGGSAASVYEYGYGYSNYVKQLTATP